MQPVSIANSLSVWVTIYYDGMILINYDEFRQQARPYLIGSHCILKNAEAHAVRDLLVGISTARPFFDPFYTA